MLLLDDIVEHRTELAGCKELVVYTKLLFDSGNILQMGVNFFICSLTNLPMGMFNPDGKRLDVFSFSLILLQFFHLNYYQIYMKTDQIQLIRKQQLILDPIILLSEQLKNKAVKKIAIQQIGTIALTLSPSRIKEELIPLLTKAFIQENIQMRLAILKSFSKLLQFIGNCNNCFMILEFVIDVLCVFSEEDIRKEAYFTLQKLMNFIDLRKHQAVILKAIQQLSVQKEKNICELVLKLIRYLMVVANLQNEVFLVGLIQKYKEGEDNQLILVSQLGELIKISPPFPEIQIHSIFQHLVTSGSTRVKTRLIEPIVLLTKATSPDSTTKYVKSLLKQVNSEIIGSLILQIHNIRECFPGQIYQELSNIINQYQSKDTTIKSAVIEVLQHIPINEERRSAIIRSHSSSKSLNLSKILANSLCKIHDIEALSQLIDNSDTEFKNKLFPKLPPTCQIHIRLMQNLLGQKNWRSKLTLLQNIEKRLQNEENVEILIPKLLEQIGDKIAVVRIGVVKLIGLILKGRKIHLTEIKKQINESLSSKNWFERQSMFLILQIVCRDYKQLEQADREIIISALKKGKEQKIQNILCIISSIKQKCHIVLP